MLTINRKAFRRIQHRKVDGVWIFVVMFIVMVTGCLCVTHSEEPVQCQWFTEPRGVLTTPNFPGPYPVPLKLCFVITRKPYTQELQHKTVIYFTQFYLLTGVSIETYTHFVGFDSQLNYGRTAAYHPVATDRPTELEIQSRFVVITVDVDRIPGVNLRVLYELMDVHGFNITYEVVPDYQPTRLNYSLSSDREPERDVCILDNCRFNGWCVADANFTSYRCRCFPGFRGPNCQYSERCSPYKNRCNGGGCEHHIGGSTSVCLCPANYTGKVCDIRIEEDPCAAKHCPPEERSACALNKQNNSRCECLAGNKLKGCRCESGYRLRNNASNGTCEKVEIAWYQWSLFGSFDRDHLRDELLKVPHITNATILESSTQKNMLRFQLTVLRDGVSELNQSLAQLRTKDIAEGRLEAEDDLVIMALVSNKILPVREGIEPVVLSCEFRAPEGFQVLWYKDGALLKPSAGSGNLWIEHGQRTRSGVYTSYLGLDRVQYIDKGLFTCEVRHGEEVRQRSLQMLIRMVPSGHVTPLAQSVEIGQRHELTCTLRVIEKVQYRWFKNTERDESFLRGSGGSSAGFGVSEPQQRKQWTRIPVKGQVTDPEYAELLYPAYSRLVIPKVSSYAEYQCQIEDSSGTTTAIYAHVFPYDNSSLFCPSEFWMGIQWNQTVLGGYDVQPCHMPWGPAKGDARRRCLLQEGSEYPQWEAPDFSECAYDEIYNIRKQVLAVVRGYQQTTAVGALRLLREYIENRHGGLLPGEGNHLMETLHEILDYEESLRSGHPERLEKNEALQLFLDCVSMTFSVADSVLDERIYAKLHEMISRFVVTSLDEQPADTEFRYSNSLFDVYGRVFNAVMPSDDHVAVYEVSLEEQGIAGYLVRPQEQKESDRVILSLWVPKSLARDYLARLEWIQTQGDRSLRSKMVNLRTATKFKNGSSHFGDQDELHVNFRMQSTINTTLSCAVISGGNEVSFKRAALHRVSPDEFSCSLISPHDRQAALIALYEAPLPVTIRPPVKHRQLLQLLCASGGLVLSSLCALSIMCTVSCWSLIKCVKWNVCLALLSMFSAAIFEASPFMDQWQYNAAKPVFKLLRQFFLLVVLGQQLVVLVSFYAELFEKKFFRGEIAFGGYITCAVSAPWLSAGSFLGLAYMARIIWDTDSTSYWGTLESQVSLPSAAFTMLATVAAMVYILLHFEISAASEERSRNGCISTLSISQKALLRRSVLIAFCVFIHGLTTSGYLQDPNGNYQAITSIILALVVFLVYTAYCETDVFYHAVWAHYKNKQEVKPMTSH